jgi:Cu/Ag efflux protein CusF
MMKKFGFWLTAFCMAGALSLVSAAPPKGEAAGASLTVTATVTKIDQKTREVTLKTTDGDEYSFVAGDGVKNLAQVKKGDVVTATYAEAIAYEVKKGGTAAPVSATFAGAAAAPGAKPAGAVGGQVTVTVVITKIDTKAPSVTVKAADGETRKFKVMHPEKLEGVSVGDTVEITYTEALAIKVDKASKK